MSQYNKQITINSIFSVLQMLVIAAVTFILYKIIISQLGVSYLGVWSLIVSLTSIGAIGSSGFNSSITKYVAEFSAKESEKISGITNTTILICVVFYLVIFLSIYFISIHTFSYFIELKYIALCTTLLQIALISLYINSLAMLYFSVIEGYNLSYLKSASLIFTNIIFFLICVIFLKNMGLMAIAYAQVLQSILLLILSIYFVKKKNTDFNFITFCTEKSLIKKIFNYGFSSQIIGILQVLFDPINKIFLSKYGNLTLIGIYEIAMKVTILLKNISNSLLINLVPKFSISSSVYKTDREDIIKIFDLSFFIALLLISPVILSSFSLSQLWFSEKNYIFIAYLLLFCVGFFINIIFSSSYFIFVANGYLRYNLISFVVLSIINVVMNIVVIYYFSAKYIVVSWFISLTISSLFLYFISSKKYKISTSKMITKYHLKETFILLLFTIFTTIVSNYIQNIYLLLIFNFISILLFFVLQYFYGHSLIKYKDLILKTLKYNEKNS